VRNTELRGSTLETMTTTTERLSDQQIVEVMALVKDADSVELKLTVPESARRSAVAALEMDPLDAQIRQVFFFDTPDLRLNSHGLVPRARRIQGKVPDSVVKLRPVVPGQLPAKLRKTPNFVVEVDAMPGGYVCSGTLKAKHTVDKVRETAAGRRPIRKLFTKEQRAFFADHAPDGITLDDLSVLGPINVLKLKFAPAGFSRPMVAELWNYPDGSRILELSTKCLPNEAIQVVADARALLTSRGIELGGHQQTKTKTALEFFSRELQAAT
jgi:hypothetical protein